MDENVYPFDPKEQKKVGKLDESKLARSATMSNAEYGLARKTMAAEMGIPVKYLDAERADRMRGAEKSSVMRPYWEIKPWHEPVEAEAIVDQLVARLKRHVVMGDEAALAVALWVMFSWVHDAAIHSPILLVSSPEAECGKTTLLSLVSLLVPRGFVFVQVSAPVLYRMIEKWHPTLIVDEADDAFKNNPELRGVINSGWTRGAGVPRCHPETHEPEFFETFGPKAIGLKGRAIPDTTLSRSIIIDMQRKLPGERAEDFGHQDDDHLAHLRQLLARFAEDDAQRLHISPRMPEGFNNRLAANWRLMLAIAELCGPRMTARARDAATVLSRRSDDASLGVELLRDIQAIRDARPQLDQIASAELVSKLGDMTDRPWAEMPYTGKPITQPQLAKLLKAYNVRPKPINMGVGEKTARGYLFESFDSAFRYIPSPPPKTTRNPVTSADFGQNCRNSGDEKVTPKMADNGQNYGVTPDLGGHAHTQDADPFASMKDESLRLPTYPDLPDSLNRRVG